jgi:hypothetical protein
MEYLSSKGRLEDLTFNRRRFIGFLGALGGMGVGANDVYAQRQGNRHVGGYSAEYSAFFCDSIRKNPSFPATFDRGSLTHSQLRDKIFKEALIIEGANKTDFGVGDNAQFVFFHMYFPEGTKIRPSKNGEWFNSTAIIGSESWNYAVWPISFTKPGKIDIKVAYRLPDGFRTENNSKDEFVFFPGTIGANVNMRLDGRTIYGRGSEIIRID